MVLVLSGPEVLELSSERKTVLVVLDLDRSGTRVVPVFNKNKQNRTGPDQNLQG